MASKSHWSTSLLTDMFKPENILKQDDHVVIIRDKYPKSKHHYLTLPKETINSITDLNTSHIGLLKHMALFADKFIQSLLSVDCQGVKYKMGFHAIPSVPQLHMHVISTDFQGAGLKTKKHWNSFNTEYFVSNEEILKQLESKGKVHFDKFKFSDLLHTPLKCHLCHKVASNMPQLKEHISKCNIK
ncbi:Aprataxin isoform X2 [Oopsacas minuta]|uniref:Aprataxin isoform X2 n=1 Tax=Oopsacas minuta TaxID=111878 RepID=A0AAV7JMT8_9METZ|nr:Aprataxin isoform X2 [Oopsacas minuta]